MQCKKKGKRGIIVCILTYMGGFVRKCKAMGRILFSGRKWHEKKFKDEEFLYLKVFCDERASLLFFRASQIFIDYL